MKVLKILETISMIIMLTFLFSIIVFTRLIPEIIMISIPLIYSILYIPTVQLISIRNQISKPRRKLLIIFNGVVNLLYCILIYFSYISDDKGYFLLMLAVLLIQGGVTGIFIKHVLISRTETRILDGKPIMYVLNILFVVIGLIMIVSAMI